MDFADIRRFESEFLDFISRERPQILSVLAETKDLSDDTVKALEELGLKKEKFASLIYGILIVEDILAISLIVILNGIATTGQLEAGQAFLSFGQLVLFMTISLALGILLVPRLLNRVARFNSKEMLLVAVLGLLFGFCLLVIQLKYSVALGAFLIGAIMAESRHIHSIEKLIEPVRDMFIAIFFVTIGSLLDPHVLLQFAWPISIISIAVVVGKVVSCSMGTFITDGLGGHLAILESFFDTLHTRGVRVYSSDQAVAMANAMADLFHALPIQLTRKSKPSAESHRPRRLGLPTRHRHSFW